MNMLNQITNTPQISFQGKTFSKKGLRECEEYYEKASKANKKVKTVAAETYRAYFSPTKVNLEKDIWGYKSPIDSKSLEKYKGIKDKTAGFSTEAGGFGGGWLKSATNTPLSTKDIHTCALLNLVNENSGEHFLYHVFHDTGANSIKKLIQAEFPRFTKANIMPGDQFHTNRTINKILEALQETNPKAVRQYYHIPVENPEVIAINGELKYLSNKNPDDMTFTQITNQYHY